jgi:DNA-binding helix-hairpin-helix protein with protein kinase domain
MSKVKGRQIHDLYNPSSRRIYFPSADWRFLIRTASNFAVAVDTLHRAGIVIGDINQGNVFVSEDAIVRLIDCDSFQIHSGTSIYRCPVGVPHFTPPELQSENLSSVDRTVNHDLFGVAVMIFHLVMGGRHPFSGRYHGDKDFPLEERIKQHHFAFGRQRQYYGIAPPPFTPLLNDLPTDIQDLFENAFQPSSGTRNRPSAVSVQSGSNSKLFGIDLRGRLGKSRLTSNSLAESSSCQDNVVRRPPNAGRVASLNSKTLTCL